MGTRLHRPVTRVVQTKALIRDIQGDQLVVTMASEGLYVREFRRRTVYGPIPYGMLFLQAARITATKIQQLRHSARKTKPSRKER